MRKFVFILFSISLIVSVFFEHIIPVSAAAPSAVSNLVAGTGDASAFLSWSAPANGGSAITDYVIRYREYGAGSWTTFSDGTSTATTATVTGLTNGTRYEFNVQAVNGDGTATDSNSPNTIPLKRIITDDFQSYITGVDVSGQNGWLPGDSSPTVLWEVYTRSGSKVVAPDDATTAADFTKFVIHQNVGANAHIGFDFSGFTEGSRFFPQVWFRRSDGVQNDEGYDTFIWPGSGGDQLIVWKHAADDAGAGPNVADEALTLSAGTIYRVEAEVVNNPSSQPVIKIWVYEKSGARGAPALTYTDASGLPFTGGYIGLGFATNETYPPASDVWYDNIDIYGAESGPAAAPIISSTSAGDSEVLVDWDTPFYTGTSSITDYVIQYKLTANSTWNTFSDGTSTTTNATVTGLTNSSQYDFRVQVVNSSGGSSYSPIARATPSASNSAPTASSVSISGYPAVGKTLTGSYTYNDADGDSEGTSTFRWLRASTSGGSYSAISGATSSTYAVQAGDEDMYLKFEVTPVSTVAPTTGSAVASSASTQVFSEAAYYHILSTGQSLAVGYSSTTALSTTQPYNNLMLTNGVEATSTPLIALVESGNGESGNVETPSSGMANTIRAADSYGRPWIVGLHGHGGAPYNDIKKGTSYYTRGMTQATNSRSYVTGTLGGAYYPKAVTITHGETDYDNGVTATTYQGYMEEMQNDYETDLNALTGRSDTIPLFLTQMNTGLTGTIAVSQLDAHRDNPGDIILVGPKYQMDYTSDHVHLTNTGSKYLGELMGKVMEKVLLGGESWNPLMPTTVSRVANVITVSFDIPEGELAIDTTTVAERPDYGFEFAQTGGNSVSISDVSLINSNTQVQITLSATPTGTNQRLRYAYTCTGNHTGAFDFLCGDADVGTYVGGNIRDTDSSTSSATGSTGLPLYDWLVAFDESINADTTAPTVSSVTSSTASGSYNESDGVQITVNFSENVTTTGTVTVNFNSGGTCTITASNASSASCTYTIGSSDSANPLDVSSISGTVADQSGNAMTNSTPATNLSASKTIIVDTTAPTVTSITSSTASGSYNATDTINVTVNFAEAITTTGIVTVTLNSGGSCTITASAASTASCTYTIGSSDSANPLDVSSVSGTITDSAGNTLTNTTPITNLSASKTIVVDTAAPTVDSITSSTANGSYKAGQSVQSTVTFSEAVTTTGTVTVTFNSGGTCTISASSSATASCTYTIAGGEDTNALDVSSISGTIEDTGGNAMSNSTPATNLSASKTIIVDTTAPTIQSITSSTASGTYGSGENVQITVTFTEAVTTTGIVTVTLNSGGSCTITASAASTASCTYSVGASDSANPLNVSSTSGTIADAADNALTDSTPATNLSASKTIVISTTSSGGGGGGGSSGSGGYYRPPVVIPTIPVTPMPVPTPLPLPQLPAVPTAPISESAPRFSLFGLSAVSCPYLDESAVLRQGSRNYREIVKLQSFLKNAGVVPWLRVDGIFGPNTKYAVNSFQALFPDETYRAVARPKPTGVAAWLTLHLINSMVCGAA